jgi:hypothetical protein
MTPISHAAHQTSSPPPDDLSYRLIPGRAGISSTPRELRRQKSRSFGHSLVRHGLTVLTYRAIRGNLKLCGLSARNRRSVAPNAQPGADTSYRCESCFRRKRRERAEHHPGTPLESLGVCNAALFLRPASASAPHASRTSTKRDRRCATRGLWSTLGPKKQYFRAVSGRELGRPQADNGGLK